MLYVAGEILLWMILAFALGVLVGWFVWGIRRRDSTPVVAEATTTAAAATTESVTVRPVVMPVEEPAVPDLPATPPAGQPAVVAAAEVSNGPAVETSDGPVTEAEPGAEPVSEPLSDEPVTEEVAVVGPPDETAEVDAAAFADESPATTPWAAPSAAHGPDLASGAAALGKPLAVDDLTVVEGIGPGVEGVLKESGIHTWDELAHTDTDRLRRILDLAGDQYRVHDPGTWPHQAALATEGRWDELLALQATLTGGHRA